MAEITHIFSCSFIRHTVYIVQFHLRASYCNCLPQSASSSPRLSLDTNDHHFRHKFYVSVFEVHTWVIPCLTYVPVPDLFHFMWLLVHIMIHIVTNHRISLLIFHFVYIAVGDQLLVFLGYCELLMQQLWKCPYVYNASAFSYIYIYQLWD